MARLCWLAWVTFVPYEDSKYCLVQKGISTQQRSCFNCHLFWLKRRRILTTTGPVHKQLGGIPTLIELSAELLLGTLSYLPAVEMARFRAGCRRARAIVDDKTNHSTLLRRGIERAKARLNISLDRTCLFDAGSDPTVFVSALRGFALERGICSCGRARWYESALLSRVWAVRAVNARRSHLLALFAERVMLLHLV